MATSGTSTFQATRDQIIRQAALQVNAISAGATMGSLMQSDFAFALNAMVKQWQADGLHIWTEFEATLFPQVGQTRYSIGSSGDHATLSYVQTELTADAADGATSITVDSITGISSADFVGVVLDDGTLFWSTASGAPSGSAITLASGLTGSAGSGNKVFAYTTKIVRPLKVIDVNRYNVAAAQDTPIDLVSRLDYNDLPNKSQRGIINEVFYDPRRADTGYMYLWMTPSTVDNLVKFVGWRAIEDFTAAGDNPDLPAEWTRCLVFNLARDMAPQYPVKGERLQQILANAESSLDIMRGWDREVESVNFNVDMEP